MLLTLLSLTQPAQASEVSGTVGVSAGALAPLDLENRQLFGFGYSVGLEGELIPHPLIGADLSLGWAQASGSGGGRWANLMYGAIGPRFHAGELFDAPADIFVDAHLGLLRSGSVGSFGWDVGLGFEWYLGERFQVGPDITLRNLIDPLAKHAFLIDFGVAFRTSFPARTTTPRDTDEDGVADAEDLCPEQPAGAQPDPERPGCAALDADGDAVVDHLDQCPTEPAGARPDANRAGCPVRDTDGDGVADPDDVCPNAPMGALADPQRVGCPVVDSDGDGILDHRDVCPTVHAGPNPDGAREGCPLPDRDNDFVPDERDACPDQPGAPTIDPATTGCPGLVSVARDHIDISTPIYFETNDSVIRLKESLPILQAVSGAITELGISALRVEGHTDDQGEPDYNLDLSTRRAQAVADWLTTNGVPDGVLTVQGYGETRPVADNSTQQGRSQNRRVDFVILDERFESKPPARGDD